jgi:asparagine synthetase B (glutamine-hydrolysing)
MRGSMDGSNYSENMQHFPSVPDKVNGFAHERLSIMDPLGGAQPLYDASHRIILCVNGEIFNHNELKEQVGK